jgi:FkbM family methyltransferase
MKMNALRRASIAARAFCDIANWPQVLPRGAKGRPVTEIRLRRGAVIRATAEHALWPHFSDIWYHRSYTKHFALPAGALVVDIGANVGVFSLFAARKAKIVYALEPSSRNFSLLRANTASAGNIVPLNLACAGLDGEASLDVSSNPVSFSLSAGGASTHRETVGVISLASLFERYRIDSCDFLKLDCEGSEFEIILDSEPALIRRIRRIVMEYHDHHSIRYTHHDLLQALRQLGFDAVAYNPAGTFGMIAAIQPQK